MLDEFTALLSSHTCSLVPLSPQITTQCGTSGYFEITINVMIHLKDTMLGQLQKVIIKLKALTTKKLLAQLPNTQFFSFFWVIQQLDVSSAFLHGTLDEDVYMIQPPGFKDPTHPNFVCILRKFICGLKQAPQVWYTALHEFIETLGFTPSSVDPSLFVWKDSVSITL